MLLDEVRRSGARFVQVSTDEVYGDLESGGSAKETDPVRPSSPYSVAKAAGDLQVPAYVRTFGVNASITRGSNTYGPNQYPEKLIPLFVTNALEGKPLPLYGDGRQIRDWLHVEDHCAGIELVLREGAPGEAYNVGGGEEQREHRRRHADPRAARRRPVAPSRTSRTARATTAATPSTRSKLRGLGWSPQRRSRTASRRRSTGTATRRDWWEPIKSGEFRAYYERQYAARLAG